MKLVKLGLASIIAAGALYAGTYKVDASHSNIGFKVKHLMISNVRGNFNDFSGSFEYDEATKTVKAIAGEVKTTSINTENEKRDNHLRADDFFDAAKFPTLTLKINKIVGDDAYGTLTIKGISKEVKFELDINGEVTDPWGNKRVGLEIEGEINRKDFGLNWHKALETGGVVVGDKVDLNFELEGILAK